VVLGITVALGIAAAPASAAPCDPDTAGQIRHPPDAVGTGTSTFTLEIDASDSVTGVSANVPGPGAVRSVSFRAGRSGDPGVATITTSIPSAGSVPLTVSWTQANAPDPCTVTETIPLRVVVPASAAPRGQGGGANQNAVTATFSFPGCGSAHPVGPMTIVVRARVGPRYLAHAPWRPGSLPAPTASSPKFTITAPAPCTRIPAGNLRLPGAGSVRLGNEDLFNGLTLRAARRFAGRGAYNVHLIVEFHQANYRTVRFRVTGYFVLADFGKQSGSVVRRI
jgi:hypothetical protein